MSKVLKQLTFICLFVSLHLTGALGQSQQHVKAQKLYELHAYHLALNAYISILNSYPNDAVALKHAANCYRLMNDMEKAYSHYQKLLQLGEQEADLYFKIGDVLRSMGRYAEAKSYFEKFASTNSIDGFHHMQSCDFAMSNANKSAIFDVRLSNINTKSSDFGPHFVDNKLVFASSRISVGEKLERIDKGGKNALFYSNFDASNRLSSPSIYQHRTGFEKKESIGPLSYKMGEVYFTKNNYIEGVRQIPEAGLELSLHQAIINENGKWEKEKAFPYNGYGYSSAYPALSEDGRFLFFASDRPGGYGGFDIYVCVRDSGGKWGRPQNCGPIVNTPGDEITPFKDGRDLYFSSNYHNGFGGMDVFRATVDENAKILNLVHMGVGINSSRDDFGLTFDASKNVGYLVSNRTGGYGNEDIYSITKMSGILSIQVINQNNQSPISSAKIDLTACGEGVFYTDSRGRFNHATIDQQNCQVTISQDGYLPKTIYLSELNSASGNRQELVALIPADKTANIAIVDDQTLQPISGAQVSITNTQTNANVSVMSDGRGNIAVPVEPGVKYIVSISAMGYSNYTESMTYNNSYTNGQLIGRFKISQSSRGLTSRSAPATYSTPTNEGINFASNPPSSTPQSMYYIQIAAYAGNKEVNMSSYESKLGSLGGLSLVEDGNKKKVRLGPYATKEEANDVNRQVISKGYKGSFRVEVTENVYSEPRQYNSSPGQFTPKSPQVNNSFNFAPEPTTNEVSPSSPFNWDGQSTASSNSGDEYLIRLGVYSKKSPSLEQKLGTYSEQYFLTYEKQPKWYIARLGGIPDLSTAKDVLKGVQNAGFKDAYIVKKSGDSFERVK